MLNIDDGLSYFKNVKQAVPLPIGFHLIVAEGNEFRALIQHGAPSPQIRELILKAIPVVGGSEAVVITEYKVRQIDSDPDVPIDEDPTAVPAVIIVHGTDEMTEFRIAPYGISDEGEVEFKEFAAYQSPDCDTIMAGMKGAFKDGDQHEWQASVLNLIVANQGTVSVNPTIYRKDADDS